MKAIFKKMGMDFYKKELSDVGNYRVRAEFTDRAGVQVVADFSGGERLKIITNSRGKKKVVTDEPNALHVDGCFHDAEGCGWRYHPETVGVDAKGYHFTRADLLRFLSDVTGCEFTEIEFI